MNTIFIKLTDDDLAKCKLFAENLFERHKSTSQAGLVDKDKIHKDQGRINFDYISKASEAAVAQYLNIPVNYEINKKLGGDGGYDLAMTLPHNNKDKITINVKSSTNPNAERLIWPINKPMDHMADVLIFATTGEINSEQWGQFELRGWITGFQFKKLCSKTLVGEPLLEGTPYMDAYCLTPMKFLSNNN